MIQQLYVRREFEYKDYSFGTVKSYEGMNQFIDRVTKEANSDRGTVRSIQYLNDTNEVSGAVIVFDSNK